MRAPKDRIVTPAIAGSLAVLAVAFLLSVMFVVSHGGLTLTAAAATPTGSSEIAAALATASPTPTPAPTASPTEAPSPTPEPTPSPSPTPTASASPDATPVATANPATPKPTSNRYALLKPCPDAPNCYLYVIRSGDNLYSIANYFGVSLASVQAMNPWTTTTGLKVGRSLRLPPPTR